MNKVKNEKKNKMKNSGRRELRIFFFSAKSANFPNLQTTQTNDMKNVM